MIKLKYSYKSSYPWAVEALKRDSYICQDCKKEKLNLIVHHIDESRKNGRSVMNNDLSNLVTLCRNCHGKRHGGLVFKNPNTELILELRNQGKTYKEIGDYLGITRQRIHQIVRKNTP